MNALQAAPLARRTSLSLCVAALLSLPAPSVLANPSVYIVTDCGDAASGLTLRNVISGALSGDIVELGALPCSTVTLATGGTSIDIPQHDLVIRNSSARAITVNGAALQGGDTGSDDSRVFSHGGDGTLTIDHVDVSGGHVFHSASGAHGGCISSNGPVVLSSSVVSGCTAQSAAPGGSSTVFGGAIYAMGDVVLTDSAVAGSAATSSSSAAKGGGIYASGQVQATRSVISNNAASAAGSYQVCNGGGIHAGGKITLAYSTVSGNSAYSAESSAYGGGLFSAFSSIDVRYSAIRDNVVIGGPAFGSGGGMFGSLDVSVLKTTVSGNFSSGDMAGIGAMSFSVGGNTNTFSLSASTISGNVALLDTGGIGTDASTTKIYNSTIAFNTAHRGIAHGYTFAPGIALYAPFASMTVTLLSNVIAQNYFGYSPDSTEIDFSAATRFGHTVTFNTGPAHNLIRVTSATGLPADTVVNACPLLGPLRDNGGLTQTHALLSNSPAIDTGANFLDFNQDQRGPDSAPLPRSYPRVSNGAADMGSYEVNQADVLFNAAFDGCAPLG